MSAGPCSKPDFMQVLYGRGLPGSSVHAAVKGSGAHEPLRDVISGTWWGSPQGQCQGGCGVGAAGGGQHFRLGLGRSCANTAMHWGETGFGINPNCIPTSIILSHRQEDG